MIIIEDMDMPDRCTECFAYSGTRNGYCLIGDYCPKDVTADPDIGRQYWCPLFGLDISKEELVKKLLDK